MTELEKIAIKKGGSVIINGAVVHLSDDGDLFVSKDADCLSEGEVISSVDEANTPGRRIYFTLQAMYLDPHHFNEYHGDLMELIAQRSAETELAPVRDNLEVIVRSVLNGRVFNAIMACRALVEFEDAVMREYPAPPAKT